MFRTYLTFRSAYKPLFKLLLLASVMVVSHVAAIEPARFDSGVIGFTPTLEVGEAYDDNVTDAPDGEESWVTSFAPTLMLDALDGLNYYQLKYRLFNEQIHSSDDDSHTDHNISALARFELNARNRLKFTADYKDITERRDDRNIEFDESGNESNRWDIEGLYGFGVKSAKGQIELGAKYGELRFDNNFNSGSLNNTREYDETSLNATFYYRVGGRTRLLAEVIRKDFDYVLSGSLLGSESDIYRGGLEWEATAKTTGRIAIGNEHKDFDKGKSVSNSSWEASLAWQPRTYSTITLSSSSQIDEGSATEAFTEVSDTKLSWNHNWSEKLSSEIGYGYKEENFKGGSNDRREDESDIIDLGMNYAVRRWADVGCYYKYTNTDSDDPLADFHRNVIGLKVNMSL